MNRKIFNSKILLFGEYTVTLGSGALAVPYEKLGGFLDFSEEHSDSTDGFKLLYDHLSGKVKFKKLFDLTLYKNEMELGLIFRSNIPSGYGLGSSGSLVAAFYDRYCIHPESDYSKLKNILGEIESAFHGASSGLDPLVSYVNTGIFIKDDGTINSINLEYKNSGFFLIDTGTSRHTEYYVNLFKQKLTNSSSFRESVKWLSDENKRAIDSTFVGDKKALYEATERISRLQLEHFQEMIPNDYKVLWEEGLNNGAYCLKLCGAGGGGMILGLLSDFSNTSLADKTRLELL